MIAAAARRPDRSPAARTAAGVLDIAVNGRNVHGGGIEWTIKQGTPYHVPTLMKEVKDLVAKARADRSRQTTAQ